MEVHRFMPTRFLFFRAQCWMLLNIMFVNNMFREAHSLHKPKLLGMGKRMLGTSHIEFLIVTSKPLPALLSL